MSIFKKSNKISAIWWRERERERERIFNCEEIRFLIILGIIRKEELTLDVCLSKTKWDQDPLHFL